MFGALVRGAVAGGVATWVMDVVTTKVQSYQSPADSEREKAAWPNGRPSVDNLVDLAAMTLGAKLDKRQKAATSTITHYALGALPGAGYALLRNRIPLLGAGRGVAYGLLLWAVNDELLNTALGLAGPPEAYPASSHVRGLIGHVVLGVATDLGIDLLGVA
jgi:hypothetical protein